MNEQELEQILGNLIEAISVDCPNEENEDDEQVEISDARSELAGVQVKTFEQVGLLTRNRGLVLTMEDGTRFQVSIVQA